MKCYKVVRKVPDAAGVEKTKFVSCIVKAESAAQVTYPVNEEARAHPIMLLVGYGLCAFTTAEQALEFAKYREGNQVWLAEGRDEFNSLPRSIEIDALNGTIFGAAIRVKTHNSGENHDWPEGTKMFRGITLKKCLKIVC